MPNRLVAFTELALAVAERVLPERAHKFAPKSYAQPQLFACLLLKEYLHLDYRSAEEVIEASDCLRRTLRLRRTPDYTTLWRFAQGKVTPEMIEEALAETVRLLPCRAEDTRSVALDSAGLWTTHASRYFEARRGDTPRRQRSWMKWAAALWTEPQVVVLNGYAEVHAAISPISFRYQDRPLRCFPSTCSWPTPGTIARPITDTAGKS